ncbi:hypothetical protein J2S40_003727 [Nocardioides luteus]|uniref:Uncharacterized protein n=1 Tax=Nocardioides luteus TaxID=1844 RepID=A0ABQ5SZC4_9ACTN|nr:hypothetical protein [Nocardioides luteus]MDR7312669.1 hypothetical protein [Nocardioides luteus]GGR46722.1 hypothetical protein GCM10010197_10540 [Nocardioides luteus]GLJ68918.1 hypothetical protein GCM10017579_29540 [Nocardioides luteus]
MTDPALGATQPSTGPLAIIESMRWPTRQWLSVAVSVVLTPIALASLMSGGYLHYTEATLQFENSPVGVGLMILGALLLLVVSAVARVAGIGPVAAGVLCALFGVVAMFSRHFLWDATDLFGVRSLQIGTLNFAIVLLPAVGALLIGTGFSGRWKRDAAERPATGGAIVEL